MRRVIATALMLFDSAVKIIGRTDVIPASAAQDVNPSHKNCGSAGTRTRNQRLKRALLYQLSYRPGVELQFGLAAEIFNAEPNPKAFGAALPIELPTLAEHHFLMPARFFNVQ
jgi:hypothetical protein